jgi:hypothetical protein
VDGPLYYLLVQKTKPFSSSKDYKFKYERNNSVSFSRNTYFSAHRYIESKNSDQNGIQLSNYCMLRRFIACILGHVPKVVKWQYF